MPYQRPLPNFIIAKRRPSGIGSKLVTQSPPRVTLRVAGEAKPERAMEENIRHAGSVNEWIGNRYDVADAAERTGLPAPPDVDLLEWLGDSATVTVGEDDGE